MINRINKIINNKFSIFLKSTFFLRYLFSIFFVAIVLFLFIPQFFDYQNRRETIKSFLSQTYNLNIDNIGAVRYKPLPIPSLELDNLTSTFNIEGIKLKTKKLIIYPKLLSIYNYKNFEAKKIKIENGEVEIDFNNIEFFLKNIYKLQNKLNLKNLNFKITDTNQHIINLKKINFFNYGYKRNEVNGEIFGRNFKIEVTDNYKKINFKLLKTGVNVQIFLNKNESPYSGSLKGRVLKSNYKLDFILNENLFEIENFFFRHQDISFNSSGIIELKPFFQINLISEIENFNPDLLRNLDLEDLSKFKDFIKRFNSQNKLIFQSKRFQRKLINYLEVNSKLAYGRLYLSKNFKISKSIFKCKSDVNLLDEYPVLHFECLINSPNKKDLLKQINVDFETEKKPFDLVIEGNINILNNKVNFSKIEMNNYKASKEDLKFFKSKFESNLLDSGFMNMFILSKIKKFIEEIN